MGKRKKQKFELRIGIMSVADIPMMNRYYIEFKPKLMMMETERAILWVCANGSKEIEFLNYDEESKIMAALLTIGEDEKFLRELKLLGYVI